MIFTDLMLTSIILHRYGIDFKWRRWSRIIFSLFWDSRRCSLYFSFRRRVLSELFWSVEGVSSVVDTRADEGFCLFGFYFPINVSISVVLLFFIVCRSFGIVPSLYWLEYRGETILFQLERSAIFLFPKIESTLDPGRIFVGINVFKKNLWIEVWWSIRCFTIDLGWVGVVDLTEGCKLKYFVSLCCRSSRFFVWMIEWYVLLSWSTYLSVACSFVQMIRFVYKTISSIRTRGLLFPLEFHLSRKFCPDEFVFTPLLNSYYHGWYYNIVSKSQGEYWSCWRLWLSPTYRFSFWIECVCSAET